MTNLTKAIKHDLDNAMPAQGEQWIPVKSWIFLDSINRPVERGGRLVNEIRVESGSLVLVKDSDGQEILIRLPDNIRLCKREKE